MPSLNESLYSTPAAKRALKLQGKRLSIAESVRAKAGKSAMTYEQKLATAVCLENTARQIRAVESVNFDSKSATQPGSIGQYKRFALDMVGTIIPSLIAPEVVSVQAIDNRVGMINILEYQYGSNKGAAERDKTFASPLFYNGMNEEYTTGHVTIEATREQVTAKVINPDWKPVLKAYNLSQSKELKINEDGTIGDNNGDATFKAGDVIVYTYDNETVPVQSPQIKLNIKSLPVETKARKLSAIWSFDAQYELSKEYGADLQQLLATQATAEIQQEIDNEITLDLYRIANAGPELSWSKVQPVGVNMVDHYDSFWNKLVEGSNQIFQSTRRARANFMICGLGVDAVVKTMRNFESDEDPTAIGPHFIGTLGGQLKVYVNPNYDPNEFVLGYKGTTLMDAGYVYCPYMPVLTTGMVTLADDFAGREGWATLYGKKAVNPRLYVRGHIDG